MTNPHGINAEAIERIRNAPVTGSSLAEIFEGLGQHAQLFELPKAETLLVFLDDSEITEGYQPYIILGLKRDKQVETDDGETPE